MYVFFFFFQAEDGIRDTSVTGVQTCALPISMFSKSKGIEVNKELAKLKAAASTSPPTSSASAHPPIVDRQATSPASKRSQSPKIGRASCRERVYISVVADGL